MFNKIYKNTKKTIDKSHKFCYNKSAKKRGRKKDERQLGKKEGCKAMINRRLTQTRGKIE